MRPGELRRGVLCAKGGSLNGQPTTPVAVPIQPRERIAFVDVLRGFALFGILVVNVGIIGGPTLYSYIGPPGQTQFDRVLELGLTVFARSRFYSLFSLLFGMSLGLQMRNLERRGVEFVPLYGRRLLVLLVLGLLHAFLIWHGDILVVYALVGGLLMLVRRLPARVLVLSALVLFVGSLLYTGATSGLHELQRGTTVRESDLRSGVAGIHPENDPQAQEAIRRYGSGSYGDIMDQRLDDLRAEYSVRNLRGTVPQIFMMFLLGLGIVRSGILDELPRHRRLIRTIWLIGAATGLAEVILVVLYQVPEQTMPPLVAATWNELEHMNRTMLCLFYASSLALLIIHRRHSQRLFFLAAPGRMALTNYLLQSVVCTTVFYSYGLGLYGTLRTSWGLLLACTLYMAQIVLSNWYLRRCRYGPVEWLWRSLTYGARQPFLLRS